MIISFPHRRPTSPSGPICGPLNSTKGGGTSDSKGGSLGCALPDRRQSLISSRHLRYRGFFDRTEARDDDGESDCDDDGVHSTLPLGRTAHATRPSLGRLLSFRFHCWFVGRPDQGREGENRPRLGAAREVRRRLVAEKEKYPSVSQQASPIPSTGQRGSAPGQGDTQTVGRDESPWRPRNPAGRKLLRYLAGVAVCQHSSRAFSAPPYPR